VLKKVLTLPTFSHELMWRGVTDFIPARIDVTLPNGFFRRKPHFSSKKPYLKFERKCHTKFEASEKSTSSTYKNVGKLTLFSLFSS